MTFEPLRDRPFNLQGVVMVFCFVQATQELEYFFFFQNLTLGYMTKTLNQIIFVFLHQNQNFFFSNIGNQNIFLEINRNPPPPCKLNGRSLNECILINQLQTHRSPFLLIIWLPNTI
jgi:hypothetical protein